MRTIGIERRRAGRRAAAVGAWLAPLTLAGCLVDGFNVTSPGERGDHQSYGVRLHVNDAATGRPLAGVLVVVKDGPLSEIMRERTDPAGRVSFTKMYFRRRLLRYGKITGYPDDFLIVYEKDGYTTLQEYLPAEKLQLGVGGGQGFLHHEIELRRGRGIVKKGHRPKGRGSKGAKWR